MSLWDSGTGIRESVECAKTTANLPFAELLCCEATILKNVHNLIG